MLRSYDADEGAAQKSKIMRQKIVLFDSNCQYFDTVRKLKS